jgi:hypothetical protein
MTELTVELGGTNKRTNEVGQDMPGSVVTPQATRNTSNTRVEIVFQTQSTGKPGKQTLPSSSTENNLRLGGATVLSHVTESAGRGRKGLYIHLLPLFHIPQCLVFFFTLLV